MNLTLTTSPVKAMKMKGVDHHDTARVAALIADDDWIVQQKFDGTRVTLFVDGTDRRLLAADGSPLRHAAAVQWADRLLADLPTREGAYQVDGELLTADGTFVAFDLLVAYSLPVWERPYFERRLLLSDLATECGPRFVLADEHVGSEAKAAMIARVDAESFEGVVFKRRDAKYRPGVRTDTQLKLKFYRECDAIVTARNVDGRTNASLAVYDVDGSLRPIGSCSMLGKPDAAVGDVVEVKYLNAGTSGWLYQPTLLRIRHDKAAGECSIDQLRLVRKGVL